MSKDPPARRPAPPGKAHAGAALRARPRIRRGYFECRYGQLHVHNSIPAGGGFEEGTPLVCLHPSPLSGGFFTGFLAAAGAGRSIFAPDLPGFGDSDPPPSRAGVAEHAAAIGDFLDAMRLRQIDVLGQRFGALVAAELAATRPGQVRRMVLVSPPATSDAVQSAPQAAADGSHLLEEWSLAVAFCGPGTAPNAVTASLAERLRNQTQAAPAAQAERDYPLRARLAQLSVPLLVLRLRHEARATTAPDREWPARARLMEIAEHGASFFETAPEAAAGALESFLR